jgi:hypothetical protein
MITLQAVLSQVSVTLRRGAYRLCISGGVSPSLPSDRTCIAGALFIMDHAPPCALRGMTSMKSKSHRGAHGPRVERSSTGTCSKVRYASLLVCTPPQARGMQA